MCHYNYTIHQWAIRVLICAVSILFNSENSWSQYVTTAVEQSMSSDLLRQENFGERALNSPLCFVKNNGQWDDEVLYMATVSSQNMWFTKSGIRHDVRHNTHDQREEGSGQGTESDDWMDHIAAMKGHVFDLKLIGISGEPVADEKDKSSAHYNYFIGNDPSKWASNVPLYHQLWHRNAYDGVDIHYYPTPDGLMEYDFILQPGADVEQIKMRYEGLDGLSVDEFGKLILQTSIGDILVSAPYSYQLDQGIKREVKSRYTIFASGEIGIEFPEGYRSDQVLVVDPILLEWSTFVHGALGAGFVYTLKLDSQGNPMIGGSTNASDFPTTLGGYYGGVSDAFLSKLTNSGDALIFSTFFGGDGDDFIYAMTLTSNDEPIITGFTTSTDLLTSLGCYDPDYNGDFDGYVAILSATADAVNYCTYVGGSDEDRGEAIELDSQGNVFVVGRTQSPDLNATFGAHSSKLLGSGDAFVVKLTPTLSGSLFLTYLGGTGEDLGFCLQMYNDEPVVGGSTSSLDFPTTAQAFASSHSGIIPDDNDGFVVKLNSEGSTLIFSTYLGGMLGDAIGSMIVDQGGNIIVCGQTLSPNFPTTPNAFSTVFGGLIADAYVTKLNASGSELMFSTFVGGIGLDVESINEIGLNEIGDILLVGNTVADNYPTTADAHSHYYKGGIRDIVFSKLSGDGSDLVYSTYLGGAGNDITPKSLIAIDGDCVYGIGSTNSLDFPTTPGAYQEVKLNGGGFSNFAPVLFKFCEKDILCPIYDEPVLVGELCSGETLDITVPNATCNGWLFFKVVGNYGDDSANEITWNVTSDLTGNIVASGGPGVDGRSFEEVVILPEVLTEGNNFTLNVADAGGNGLSTSGYLQIEEMGSAISGQIMGDFGTSATMSFEANILVNTSLLTIQSPSGNYTDDAASCEDHEVQISLNSDNFCKSLEVNLPWEIVCQETGEILASGNESVSVYPQSPSDYSDLLSIRWDSLLCQWHIDPQNDCDLLDLETVFSVSPDVESWEPYSLFEDGTEDFTVDYYGVPGGLNCTSPIMWNLPAESYSACESYPAYIPNTFTPNGDQFNDGFGPVFSPETEVDHFHFVIRDRWGAMVWESFDRDVTWDGTFNGVAVPDGTYVWSLEYVVLSKLEFETLHGHVLVIR